MYNRQNLEELFLIVTPSKCTDQLLFNINTFFEGNATSLPITCCRPVRFLDSLVVISLTLEETMKHLGLSTLDEIDSLVVSELVVNPSITEAKAYARRTSQGVYIINVRHAEEALLDIAVPYAAISSISSIMRHE